MKDLLRYFVAGIASFLPPRYRPEVDRGGGVVSGIIETLGALLILALRAVTWTVARTEVDIRTALVLGGAEIPGSGIFLLVEFWMNPFHIALFYFVIEGLVRTLAALIGHQVLGTAPLYIFSALHNGFERRMRERRLGPLVIDEVVCGGGRQGYDLKVYSCRPKLHWNPYITIEFEGAFYQYVREEYGTLPRRFTYYLRRNPIGRTVVVIDHYALDNVLQPMPEKWVGMPTLWEYMFPNWNLPPLVPDEIVRGGSLRQDYDLKIYSCRPKRDWNPYVTIEFEQQWYRLLRDERGSSPRPFVYYLRKVTATRPAVVIRRYDEAEVLKASDSYPRT